MPHPTFKTSKLKSGWSTLYILYDPKCNMHIETDQTIHNVITFNNDEKNVSIRLLNIHNVLMGRNTSILHFSVSHQR